MASDLGAGHPLEATVELPSRLHGFQRGLHCHGSAVWWRQEQDDLCLGVAINRMRFCDLLPEVAGADLAAHSAMDAANRLEKDRGETVAPRRANSRGGGR